MYFFLFSGNMPKVAHKTNQPKRTEKTVTKKQSEAVAKKPMPSKKKKIAASFDADSLPKCSVQLGKRVGKTFLHFIYRASSYKC